MAGKDIMLDPRAGIRKAGAMPPLMALLREVVEVRSLIWLQFPPTCIIHMRLGPGAVCAVLSCSGVLEGCMPVGS